MLKLTTIGVCGQRHNATKSCSIRVNGALTESFDVDLCVKQGCIISPTPFAFLLMTWQWKLRSFTKTCTPINFTMTLLFHVVS